MALDRHAAAALALHRFGLGPRAGSIAAIASDPRGALLAELERPDAGRIKTPDLLSAGEAARLAFNFRTERQAQQIAQRKAEEERAAAGGATMENPTEPRTEASPAANPGEPPPDPAAAEFLQGGAGAPRCGGQRGDRVRRAAGVVLVEPFLHLGRFGAQHGRRL